MEIFVNTFQPFVKPILVVIGIVVLFLLNSLVFKKIRWIKSDENIYKKGISFFLILFGLFAFIISLPIKEASKEQIFSLLGIVLSAGIALSSTTILGNLIAGVMSNSINNFKNGDLIKIKDIQGRVVKKSIFHTEIQLEDSNFISIPNLYVVTNPVKLIRKANTVIATSVSLGYDVSRIKIEKVLKEAAIAAELSDPYVYITSLGDFSVVYKIHGFLKDSSVFFSTKSLLNGYVMDFLHKNEIEIVSPTFMNQRRADDDIFIPKQKIKKQEIEQDFLPEELVFDEAIKSGEIEKKKAFLLEIEKKQEALKEQLKSEKDILKIKKLENIIERINKVSQKMKEKMKEQEEQESL